MCISDDDVGPGDDNRRSSDVLRGHNDLSEQRLLRRETGVEQQPPGRSVRRQAADHRRRSLQRAR